jgi:hypothetical protein
MKSLLLLLLVILTSAVELNCPNNPINYRHGQFFLLSSR